MGGPDQLSWWLWHHHHWLTQCQIITEQCHLNTRGKIYDHGYQEFLTEQTSEETQISLPQVGWHPQGYLRGIQTQGEGNRWRVHVHWSVQRNAWITTSRTLNGRTVGHQVSHTCVHTKETHPQPVDPQNKTSPVLCSGGRFWGKVHW